MPIFKFGKTKTKYNARQKSSSMGTIYKDYGDGSHLVAEAEPQETHRDMEDLHHEAQILRTRNDALQHENNLLKLKVEILLDMLAQKTAEAELQEGDIRKMKQILAD